MGGRGIKNLIPQNYPTKYAFSSCFLESCLLSCLQLLPGILSYITVKIFYPSTKSYFAVKYLFYLVPTIIEKVDYKYAIKRINHCLVNSIVNILFLFCRHLSGCWIAIYPVDSIIHPVNNWVLNLFFYIPVTVFR